jgi:hypothetical protein
VLAEELARANHDINTIHAGVALPALAVLFD